MDLKVTKKKEKNQELKQKNEEFSKQITNLLSLIEKNSSNQSQLYKKEGRNFEKLKPNYLPEKELSLKKDETNTAIGKNLFQTKEKFDKYSELEKYALEIINDFD